jgi:hypothetical protein
MEACIGCGQLIGVKEYDDKLWEVYYRIRDGRSTWEPLVYTQDDLDEAGFYDGDEYDRNSVMLSMERNMHERGLCTVCGRPDLSGVTEDMIMTEEEAKDLHEMWAEQAAERRMGA